MSNSLDLHLKNLTVADLNVEEKSTSGKQEINITERVKYKNYYELMKSFNISLLVVLLISLSHAFYVPGIAPREFSRGSKIGEILMMLADGRFFFR